MSAPENLFDLAGLKDAAFRDDAGNVFGRRDVERGIVGARAARADARLADEMHFVFVALLDRDGVAGLALEVDRRTRRGDVKRDAVFLREHSLLVRADLVGGVTVGGNAVGADEAEVYLAVAHVVAAGIVGDDFVR